MEVAAELCGEGAVGLVYRLIDHSFSIQYPLESYRTVNLG